MSIAAASLSGSGQSGSERSSIHEIREMDVADAPFTRGWSSAAVAVHSILSISTPMFLRLRVDDHPSLLVDFRHHAYDWSTPIERFPSHPANVDVETEATTESAPALFVLPGRSLDGLLWMMGLNSFGDLPASWLRPGDSYHLVRWPNLSQLRHTVAQMHMTAMLGNAALTPAQLANVAGVTLADAQRLINALSLMGILEASRGPEAPEPVSARRVIDTPAHGLFARLRVRLGF